MRFVTPGEICFASTPCFAGHGEKIPSLFLLSKELGQSLNVEKKGWDFFPMSGKATNGEKRFPDESDKAHLIFPMKGT